MTDWYYADPRNTRHGPVTRDALLQLRQDGIAVHEHGHGGLTLVRLGPGFLEKVLDDGPAMGRAVERGPALAGGEDRCHGLLGAPSLHELGVEQFSGAGVDGGHGWVP